MAQAPPPPSASKEVAKEPVYILVSLKTMTRAPGVDSAPWISPTKHVARTVSIAPYYKKAVTGQRAKLSLKNFKNKQALVVVGPNLVVAKEGCLSQV